LERQNIRFPEVIGPELLEYELGELFNLYVFTLESLVNSDDPNGSFWKDDAIEIVTDALADGFDNNTDNSKDPVGGHSYVNFQGRLSAWDENAGAKGSQAWANEVDWKYGASGDVFGKGAAVTGGWHMEARFHKRMFESPTAGNKLRNGYRMGFNIGLDDDDKKGPGANGDKSRSQDVKHIVSQLQKTKREEHTLHRKVHRPWGWYDSIDEGERFKVKRIQVNPGASLSLQKHYHRAEHWVVVKGTAEITNGDKTILLAENQSTYIPFGEVHRLSNPGTTPLEIIEVQSGSYLGEDDIVRFEDTYGRK